MVDPWRVELAAGHPDAAWDRFIEAHRSLILATIRRTIADPDVVMDVFASVCGKLSADGLARLRAYDEQATHTGKFSSWLVALVRNEGTDWLRREHGRPRARVPDGLSEVERTVFQAVFVERASHVEAYERVRAGPGPPLSFSDFLKTLRHVYRAVGIRRVGTARLLSGDLPPLIDPSPSADQLTEAAETAAVLQAAMKLLGPDERLAVQLYVLDGLSAADVARLLHWPNAKAVYNSVYRSLATLRGHLADAGITSPTR